MVPGMEQCHIPALAGRCSYAEKYGSCFCSVRYLQRRSLGFTGGIHDAAHLPPALPHLSFISNFHEINLRTYVTDGEHHGVYFLSIEAGKLLSAYLSRTLSGLPYQKARMSREYGKHYSYNSINPRTGNFLDIDFSIGDKLSAKTELDTWLTERYYLYMDKGSSVSIFPVHHPEWELKNIDIHQLDLSYRIGETELSQRNVELMHYSPGVKVIAWPDKKI